MKTSNFNNSESKNRVINYDIEIVRDFDGTYYVNARNELHEHIKGLPEYLPYKELKKAVKEALGVTLPPLKSLTFEGNGRKQYANAYGLQGIEIHQEPLAFGLQDKVVLGSFGESRPYAIGCTVTGYRWDSEVGEFLYILQGEDGKKYADFARNIIPDNSNDPKGGRKATLEPTSEITEQREQNDACISSAESRRDKANGQITDGAKKESFGKMFIYRLYIKWKWMQQRFERIGDMDRAADCFYHRLRLTKLYIYQPGWRIMDYGDMKPIFFPRQRIK